MFHGHEHNLKSTVCCSSGQDHTVGGGEVTADTAGEVTIRGKTGRVGVVVRRRSSYSWSLKSLWDLGIDRLQTAVHVSHRGGPTAQGKK